MCAFGRKNLKLSEENKNFDFSKSIFSDFSIFPKKNELHWLKSFHSQIISKLFDLMQFSFYLEFMSMVFSSHFRHYLQNYSNFFEKKWDSKIHAKNHVFSKKLNILDEDPNLFSVMLWRFQVGLILEKTSSCNTYSTPRGTSWPEILIQKNGFIFFFD